MAPGHPARPEEVRVRRVNAQADAYVAPQLFLEAGKNCLKHRMDAKKCVNLYRPESKTAVVPL